MNEPSLFEQLEREINWDNAFQEAASPLFDTVQLENDGQATLQKIENLMQMAEHQAAFVDLQLLAARMGQLCCNPTVVEMFRSNDYLGNLLDGSQINHDDCDDDEDDDEDDNDAPSKKSRKKRHKILKKYKAIKKSYINHC